MVSAIVQNSDSLAIQRGLNVGETLLNKKNQGPVIDGLKPQEADLAVDNKVSYTSLPKNNLADDLSRQLQSDVTNIQTVSQGLTKINDSLGDLTLDVPMETVAREIDTVVENLKSEGALIPVDGKSSSAGFVLNVKTEKVRIPDITSRGLGVKNAVYASAGGILLTNGNMDTTVLGGNMSANEDLRAAIANSAAMSISAQQANLGALQAKLARIVKQLDSGAGVNSAGAHHLVAQIKTSPDLLRAQAHSFSPSVKRLTK